MLPHCGKCTSVTGSVQATIIIPIKDKPVAVEYFELVKKNNSVNPEPKLPPAPVRPEITPSDRLEMKGMMPKVAPHAAWAPMENRIIDVMESGSVLARPRQIQKMPPAVWRIHRFHSRPLMPNLLALCPT